MQAKIIDAYERRKDYVTFETPYETAEEAMDEIMLGDYVKVGFEVLGADGPVTGERFWLKVIEINGKHIRGVVQDYLFLSEDHGIYYGDLLTVEPRHVLAHMAGKEGL